MMHFFKSGRGSSKLLFVAVVTFVLSIQFETAFHLMNNNYSDELELELEFEPPETRRWEGGMVEFKEEDDDKLSSNNLRGNGAPIIEQQQPGGPTTDHDKLIPVKQQTSPSRRVPRGIDIAYPNGILTVRKKMDPHRDDKMKEDSIPLDAPEIQSNWYEPNAHQFIDGYDMSVCVPMHDWQTQSFPNCNKFHELNLHQMRVINKGGSRIAMEMRQNIDGEESKFVYKTVKYNKEISMKLAEEQRKDSLVMERTTLSKFIPDIHGYCSLGVMMDFMPEGTMHDYIKGARLAGGSSLPPVDRLRISIHIASSVADLHTIDDTSLPSMFHNDIFYHQYLFQNGIFKLNDFNYARPIYKNKKTGEQCTRGRSGMSMWKGRSLEDFQLKLKPDIFRKPKPDKIDVWMMGNLIYSVLTDLYLFEKPKNLNWKESGWALIEEKRSEYPKHIANSKDPANVAMKKALDMCWVQNWEKRPTAQSVRDYLMGELKNITGEVNPDVRVALPERDPNQRSTESDFEKYND